MQKTDYPMSFRIEPEVKRMLKELAAKDERSMSSMIAILVKEAYSQKQDK